MTQPRLSCGICGSDASLGYTGHPGYRESSTYDIYNCNWCKTSFAHPSQVDAELYELIYAHAKRIPGYHRYQWYSRVIGRLRDPLGFLAAREPMYWSIQSTLRQIQDKETTRILELGSGLGYLTFALSRAGWNVRGVDASEKAVREASLRFGDLFVSADATRYAEQTPDRFEVVIALELIEHLTDPVRFLASTLKLLAPGGRMIVTTPNRSLYSPSALWETELPPVHLWWFSEESLCVIGRTLNATVHLVDFSEYNRKHGIMVGQRRGSPRPVRGPILDAEGQVLPEQAINGIRRLRAYLGFLPGAHVLRDARRRGRMRVALQDAEAEDLRRADIVCAVFQPLQGSAFE